MEERDDMVPEQGVNEGVQDTAEEVAADAEVGEPDEGDGRDAEDR